MSDEQKPFRHVIKGRQIKMNDVITDRLMRAHVGVQTVHRVNGKRCFIQFEQTYDLAGDTWSLQLVSENPAKTVYFANLVSIVDCRCHSASVFRLVTRAELNEVRLAHQTVLAAEKACALLAEQTSLADAMLALAKLPALASNYRHYLINRVIGIYTKVGMHNDCDYLAAHEVLVEVAPEDSLPSARRRLEQIEKRFRAEPTSKRQANEKVRLD